MRGQEILFTMRGQHSDGRTSQLYDQLGPEGRVGEKKCMLEVGAYPNKDRTMAAQALCPLEREVC